MTREEILAMPAGRELDALVAEKIFGWRWWRSKFTGRRCLYAPGKNPDWMRTPADGNEPLVLDWEDYAFVPRYSQSMDDAMEVVRHIANGDVWRIEIGSEGTTASVIFRMPRRFPSATAGPGQEALAICRAALIAIRGGYSVGPASEAESPC